MQVKDMTVEQLRDLIRHTVEQCLEEYLGDPDAGLEVKEEVKLKLLESMKRDRVTTQIQGKRSSIDAALIKMVQDPEYQAQVLQMEAEFAVASWEALQLGESPV